MAHPADSPARGRTAPSSSRSRSRTEERTAPPPSSSRSLSRSRRSRRSRRPGKSSEDTIKARPSRQRPTVPAFSPAHDEAAPSSPVREARSGRGRSRETAPVSSEITGAGAVLGRGEREPETDYSSGQETDMDDDLFFGDFCFTCGAPLELAPSSPSASPLPTEDVPAVRSRGYCSDDCEQSHAPHVPLSRRYGSATAGLVMSPFDSPAIPPFGRGDESECSTSPSSSSSAGSPSPFNALGNGQLRLSAHDEPTQLSLPPSITIAHGQAEAKSPARESNLTSTPTGPRRLNFDYSYAYSLEDESHPPPSPFTYSVPAPQMERQQSFGFSGVQSVDSMLKFTRGRRSFGAANEGTKSPEKALRHSRKSSISSLLSLGPATSAGATTTLSHAHGEAVAAPSSPSTSPSSSSPIFPASLGLTFNTSPRLLSKRESFGGAVIAPRLPPSPTAATLASPA